MSGNERKEIHLSDQMIEMLKNGRLSAEEKQRALLHIGECDLCAQSFAESFAERDLIPLPPQFAEGVERKMSQLRITATPLSLGRKLLQNSGEDPQRTSGRGSAEDRRRANVPARRTEGSLEPGRRQTPQEKKREYRRYSCRVAVAACVTLIMLFSGTFTMSMSALSQSRVLNPDLSMINRITQDLSDFSKEIIHWEVRNND